METQKVCTRSDFPKMKSRRCQPYCTVVAPAHFPSQESFWNWAEAADALWHLLAHVGTATMMQNAFVLHARKDGLI